MTTLTKVTRTVKKLDVPRPLKSQSTSSGHARSPVPELKIATDADLIALTEAVAVQLAQGHLDRTLSANVATMYAHLKIHGSQLEQQYKDFLDRYFVVFRNGSQDERIERKTRLHLLELIELRAKHWHTSDYMSQYYRHRTSVEPLLIPTMDAAGGGGGSVSPTLPAPEAPPVLAPGEVLKTSGKFPKPTKIPGKNYSKDEVVIRNADSGKVMGIKGRRVHMIEELSDTIISFQRVSPGAKERLVQITGPNEENVNHAKHLIGDTIRRNASPVRLRQAGDTPRGSDASLNSSGSDDSKLVQKSPVSTRVLAHSYSTSDAALGEYKYTVTWGPHAIKITGTNLDVVKTAKLVLDEYFEREEALLEAGGSAGGEAGGDFFTLSSRAALLSLRDDAANGLEDDVFTPQHPEENGGEVVFRRARFSRAASHDKKEGGVAGMRQRYAYETLVHYAGSPLSRAPPAALASFPPDLARKIGLDFDGEAYLKRVRSGGTTAVVSTSEDVPDSPEPE